MKKALNIVMLLVLVTFSTVANSADNKPFNHVYYLFLKGPKEGCEDCYIPMMITKSSIDANNLKLGTIENMVIITYERDSIWQIKTDTKPLQTTDIVMSERDLMLNGKHYRFQKVDKSEAIRLLTHPEGTIPISRPFPPVANDQQSLVKGLIKDLSKTD